MNRPLDNIQHKPEKFDATTESRAMFASTSGQRTQQIRPRDQMNWPTGNEAHRTVNRSVYQGGTGERYAAARPKDGIDRPTDSLDSQTINRSTYQGGTGERYAAARPKDGIDRPTDSLDSQTINRSTYQGGVGDRSNIIKHGTTLEFGSGKVTDQSVSRLTYTQFPIERMSLSVPVEKWITAGMSFPTEYLTEQKSSFRPKPANSECPAVRIVSSKKRAPNQHMYLY